MKKRILALLLMAVILAALLAGLSVTAAAENDISSDTISGYVIPYTLKSGDTVLKVCNTLGIDFHKNQALITKINSIGDYSKLPVGKVVWLPATSVGSASDYYILKSHKVVSGDNVNTLLTKYDIASTDTMLSRVNTNLGSPVIGSTITFPVYKGNASAKLVDNTVAVAGGAATGTAIGLTTAGGTTALTSGNVVYYLYAHTMQAGDTVGAVCTANGISFNQHSALITRINGITNYNRIPVGRTVLLPTATGTNATYRVIAHQIQGGETANSICAAYGTSLAANLTLVKGLNNTNNLNYIQAGGILYVPVAGGGGVISGGGIAGGGTDGSGSGGSSDGSTTPSNAYKLSKDDCDNGSFVLKVGGSEATSAVAGKTVTIVCNGSAGYVQKTVTAHMTGDSTKVVKVTNNTFTMPDYNVTVSVVFGKATNYALSTKVTPAGTGSFELTVDEKIVTSQTYGGAAVTVKPKPIANYMVDTIKVTYKDSNGKDQEAAVTDNKFTMPHFAATVEVSFKPSAGYEYPLKSAGTPANGKFELKNSSNTVISKAKSGQEVKVDCTPDKDYKVEYIKISYYVWDDEANAKDLKTVTVSNSKFKMPTFDDEIGVTDREVTVEVKFIESKVFKITIKADTAGTKNSVEAHLGDVVGGVVVTTNNVVSKAEPTKKIVVVPKLSVAGFQIDSIKIEKEDGTPIDNINHANLQTKAWFEMPDSNVVIIPTYKTASIHTVTFAVDGSVGAGSKANLTVNATTKVDTITANLNETVNVVVVPVDDTVALESLKAVYKYNSEEYEVPIATGNNFKMPQFDVTLKGKFKVVKHTINTDYNPSAVDSLKFIVNSLETTAAASGENVVINLKMKPGYTVKEVKVTYKDSKNEEHEVTVTDNVFVMPDYEVKVKVTALTNPDAEFAITIVDPSYGTVKVVDSGNNPVTKAKKDADLKLIFEAITNYEVDMTTLSVKAADGSAVAVATDNTFKMPQQPIEVKVEFKGKTFALSVASVTGGTVKLTNTEGYEITQAQYGDTVKIETTASSGYKFVSVSAKNSSDNPITITDKSFTMPASDVTVTGSFALLQTNLSITAGNSPEHGSFKFQILGSDVVKANEGDTVTVFATPDSGYIIDTVTVVTASDKAVSVNSEYAFKMPDEAVTVTVTFKLP